MLLMAGLLCTFQAAARQGTAGADYCVTVQSAGYRPLSVVVTETDSGRFATPHPTRGGGPTYARMAHLVRAVLKAAGYPGPAFALAAPPALRLPAVPRPVTLSNEWQRGRSFAVAPLLLLRLPVALRPVTLFNEWRQGRFFVSASPLPLWLSAAAQRERPSNIVPF